MRVALATATSFKCCTEVCPEHIKIRENAIIPLKERGADLHWDPVRWVGRKMFVGHRRNDNQPPGGGRIA
jgi:hypothetical protein